MAYSTNILKTPVTNNMKKYLLHNGFELSWKTGWSWGKHHKLERHPHIENHPAYVARVIA
jgi:hypothetical protein